MAVIALALVSFGASPLLTAVLLGLWGLVATAAPVGWWTWLAQTLPDDAETGGGLLVAIVQLAIAGGAIIGGLAFDLSGYKATFELSATVLVAASGLAWLAGRSATEVHLLESNATA
ncbi:Purine ribonucleoside efflux pump NepI [compost metagenome]